MVVVVVVVGGLQGCSMLHFKRILVLFLVVLGVAVAGLWQRQISRDDGGAVLLYCAAGLQAPITEAVAAFKESSGERVELRFGGSGSLAAQLELAGGDLYLPADSSYLDSFEARGMLSSRLSLCNLSAGIAVAHGNPAQIFTVEDLSRQGLRIALCNQSAAIGLHLEKHLGSDPRWRMAVSSAVVSMGTVTEVAQAVALGVVDAGIVWDAVADQFQEIDFVALDDEALLPTAQAVIGVLAASKNHEQAHRFAAFLNNSEGGGRIFREAGYRTIPTLDKNVGRVGIP